MSMTSRDRLVVLLAITLIAAWVLCAFHAADDPGDDFCVWLGALTVAVFPIVFLVLSGWLQPLTAARPALYLPGLPGPPPKA